MIYLVLNSAELSIFPKSGDLWHTRSKKQPLKN